MLAMCMARRRNVLGWLVRHMHGVDSKFWWIPLDDIVCIFEVGLKSLFCVLGGVPFEQQGGLPIGGLLSTAAIELVCSLHEFCWDLAAPVCSRIVIVAQKVRDLYTTDSSVEDLWHSVEVAPDSVVSARYIDDLCQISSTLCDQCFLHRAQMIYP